MSRETIYH